MFFLVTILAADAFGTKTVNEKNINNDRDKAFNIDDIEALSLLLITRLNDKSTNTSSLKSIIPSSLY